MNSYKSHDDEGPLWKCGICDEPFDIRAQADACCSRLVDRSDITVGRQPRSKPKPPPAAPRMDRSSYESF